MSGVEIFCHHHHDAIAGISDNAVGGDCIVLLLGRGAVRIAYSQQWLCYSCSNGSSGRMRVDDAYGGVDDHTRHWARVLLMVTSAATANVDDGLGSASMHQRWV
jgi:hypothetical protein